MFKLGDPVRLQDGRRGEIKALEGIPDPQGTVAVVAVDGENVPCALADLEPAEFTPAEGQVGAMLEEGRAKLAKLHQEKLAARQLNEVRDGAAWAQLLHTMGREAPELTGIPNLAHKPEAFHHTNRSWLFKIDVPGVGRIARYYTQINELWYATNLFNACRQPGWAAVTFKRGSASAEQDPQNWRWLPTLAEALAHAEEIEAEVRIQKTEAPA